MKSVLFAVATVFLGLIGPAQAQEKPPAGDAEVGAAVFKKCLACHKVGPDARNGVGPALNGVVGRPAGTNPTYRYSSAIGDSGLVWDEATLTTYLRAPRKLAPGTRMSFPGLPNDQDIADVIAYLGTFDAEGRLTPPEPQDGSTDRNGAQAQER
ncbi:MAG TPA: cytochrome c family protein [Amaricoccus sp.]|uniref:c-type cytochrome n=1 Tax=Amaricoccus sp. TaxID=1872485 RepID=UPI002B9ED00C|nr:cytochrome c family protein [Amaricoccus sp.]HMQ91681.1 cytochrome c family protein [Amaricoccus sp.]HMR36613.1 cytochrome c family protein [Paracoccus sp. (in: a-proteobacteria)]HMR52216.1 cytochrome c family protein [Amaricoccus sp.]HMT99068.1 cytochrome c family protein [Amaricoccus sp.]